MKPILFEDIKFDSKWKYENSKTKSYFKSGVIPGVLIYNTVGGEFELVDSEEGIKILAQAYNAGGFNDGDYIHVLDVTNLTKASYKARQFFLNSIKQLNIKNNTRPKVTYICATRYWLRAIILFAEKFLNQNFVLVSNVAEAFKKIKKAENLSEISKNTKNDNETVTISKSEINKIIELTSSKVWGITDSEEEQDLIPKGSPLNQLYHSIKIMTSDLEETRNSEKLISEEKNKSLLQQKLLANISLEFTKLGKFQDNMNNALRLIGEFTKVSRIYIFKDIDNGKLAKNTYEWCNANVKPLIDSNSIISYQSVPSFKKRLKEKGSFFSEKINKLPQDLKDIIEPRENKSILIFPIYINRKFFGFIGFDECEKNRKWEESEIEFLGTITNIISTVIERRKTEMALKESEEQHRAIIESTSEGCWAIDSNNITIDVNDSLCKMLGYTREEMIGKSPLEFVDEENAKIFISQAQPIPNVFNRRYEITLKSKLNEDVFVIVNSTTLYDKDGIVIKSFAFVTDITKQEKDKQLLYESEEKFKAISSSANDGIVLMDNVGNVSYWNKAAEKIFGYSEDEIIGKNLHELLTPQKYRDVQNKAFAHFRNTGKGDALGKTIEIEAIRKGGEVFPIELSLSPLKINGLWNAVGMVKDITERKQIEQVLKERERDLQIILNSNTDVVFILDKFGNQLYFNDQMEVLFGYSKEEALGTSFAKYVPKKELSKYLGKLKEIFKTKKVELFESAVIHKNGTIIPIEVGGRIIEYKGKLAALGSIRDITERKKTEQALKESEDKHENLLNNLDELVVEQDINGTIIFVNKVAETIFGVPTSEIINKPFETLFKKNSYSKIEDAFKKTLNGESSQYELELKTNHIGIFTNTPMIDKSGNIIGVISLGRDVTESKKAEKALKESREQYSTLLNNLNDIVFEIDMEGKVLFTNPIAETIMGKPISEILDTPFYKFYDKKSQIKIYRAYREVFEEQRTSKNLSDSDRNKETVNSGIVELELKLKSGKLLFVKTTPIIGNDGAIIGHRGIARDITEQKKAELALLESEEKFRILFEKSDDAILVIDEGKFVDCNQSVVDLFGYSNKEEILNTHPSQLSPKQQPDGELSFQKAERMMELSLLNGSNHFEWTHTRANGKDFLAEVWLTAIPYKGIDIIHVVLRDITNRKKKEEELNEYRYNLEKLVNKRTEELIEHQEKLEDIVEERTLQFQQSEARFRSLLDNSIDAIMRFDENLRLTYVSPSIKRLTGFSQEIFLGKSREKLGFPKALNEVWNNAIRKVFNSRTKARLEFELPNNKWIDWSLVPEFDENGEVESVLTSARDITERKKDESLLRIKTEELEMFNKTMLNREMRMIELKEEVNELAKKLNQPPPYNTIWREE